MLPTTREIAMQIAVMHEMKPKLTVSEIAAELAYSPIFIINALDEAEKMELLRRDKETDAVMAISPINYDASMGLDFGEESTRVQNEILRAIANANNEKQDIERGTLMTWCRGVRPSAIDIAIHVLQQLGFVTIYKLSDPADKKSSYDFLTLTINAGQEWGSKQFKEKTNDDGQQSNDKS